MNLKPKELHKTRSRPPGASRPESLLLSLRELMQRIEGRRCTRNWWIPFCSSKPFCVWWIFLAAAEAYGCLLRVMF